MSATMYVIIKETGFWHQIKYYEFYYLEDVSFKTKIFGYVPI